ncbi:hypothetical protein GCM10009841_19800 [Microlunatus panaciterrae]|uniref:Transposase InsO family protein n=1 Tax=Microlunatus panaciterrae TaxID=400768 RepID=A0ABS2RNE0_9ACTN|nr:hypothetical protein [Microlunatus panaciterrae]MBM7800533.1 transposase InsO family protein [Microlunatus panaciterrae]
MAWCYTFSLVADVFSQRILGWAVAATMIDRLVQGHPIGERLIHHGDDGS